MEQGSKEWFEFRKQHITATNACVIMNGVHFDKTLLMLYNEKVSDSIEKSIDTFATREGKRKEPLALAVFESQTGYLMNRPTKVHPTLKWMSSSLDGYEIEGSCALEIKAPGRADHDLALKGMVPEKYIPQLQHTMEVCQLEEIYYMSYISDSDYTIFKVKKDHDYTTKLLAAEFEFWKRIQDRNPPEPTDRDSEEIKTQDWVHTCDQYRAIYVTKKDLLDQLARVEKSEDEIKNELISMADNKTAFGAGIKLCKSVRRGHYDYAKIIEEHIGHHVDLESYRKPSTESWRISFQGEKND